MCSPELASVLFRIAEPGRMRSKTTIDAFQTESSSLENELASFHTEVHEHDQVTRHAVWLYYYWLI